MRLFCPRCGDVNKYYMVEHIRKCLLFDSDGNPEGETEEDPFYIGTTKRCAQCNSKVHVLSDDGKERVE